MALITSGFAGMARYEVVRQLLDACGTQAELAPGETATLLPPASAISRCFNSDGERERQQNDSLVRG